MKDAISSHPLTLVGACENSSNEDVGRLFRCFLENVVIKPFLSNACSVEYIVIGILFYCILALFCMYGLSITSEDGP